MTPAAVWCTKAALSTGLHPNLMPAPTVLVTEPEYRRGRAVFASRTDLRCTAAPADEAALAQALAEAGTRYVVVGSVPYGERLYEALTPGGVLARFGVGHDSVDKAAATRAGVLCTNTPDVLQQSVAELTMTMIGAAARHLGAATTAMARGGWLPREGVELQGSTLAIIGCGAIGRTTARIAAAGFGMRVVGFSRRLPPPDSELARDPHFQQISDDYAAVVRDAQFVSLHIPASADNTHFISRERLALLPPAAWIINTARGTVVDEAALYDALASERLGGAALDVFAHEPYQPVDSSRDLRTLPRVILLPHVGSNTVEANRRMAERALGNITFAEAGEFAAMDLLNPEVLSPNDRTAGPRENGAGPGPPRATAPGSGAEPRSR